MSNSVPMQPLPAVDQNNYWTGTAEQDTLYNFTISEISSQLATMGIVDLSANQLRRLKSDVDRLIHTDRTGGVGGLTLMTDHHGRCEQGVSTGGDDDASTCLPESDSSVTCDDDEDGSDSDRSIDYYSANCKNKVASNQQRTVNCSGNWRDRGRLCYSSSASLTPTDGEPPRITNGNNNTDRPVPRLQSQHSDSHSSQLTRVTPRHDRGGTGHHNYTSKPSPRPPPTAATGRRDPVSAVSSVYGMGNCASPVADQQMPVRSRHSCDDGESKVADIGQRKHRTLQRKSAQLLADNVAEVEGCDPGQVRTQLIRYQHPLSPKRVNTLSSSQSAITTDTSTTKASSNWEFSSCMLPNHLACHIQPVALPPVTRSHQTRTESDLQSDNARHTTNNVCHGNIKQCYVSTFSRPLKTRIVNQTAGLHRAGDDSAPTYSRIHRVKHTSNPRAGVLEPRRHCYHHPLAERGPSGVVSKSVRESNRSPPRCPSSSRCALHHQHHLGQKGKSALSIRTSRLAGDSPSSTARGCGSSSNSPCKGNKSPHSVDDKRGQQMPTRRRPISAAPTSSRMYTTPRPSTPSTAYNVSSRYMRRNHDPVNKYHGYHRSWLTHLAPGENPRRILRWNIKTAMMHREIPLLQRNSLEVTRVFSPQVTAYLERQRQERLKSMNLYFNQPTTGNSSRKSTSSLRWDAISSK